MAVWRLWVLASGWAQPGRLCLFPFPVYGQDQVLGYALPGALSWGHLQLRIGLQLACERPVISRVLLLRPSADGAVASVALLSATLGSLHLLTRPHLPVELPRSSSGALPEGPPGLLVFLRQLEACLTLSVAGSGLAEPSRIGSWPPCVSWVSSVAMQLYFQAYGSTRNCFRGCPELRGGITACGEDLSDGSWGHSCETLGSFLHFSEPPGPGPCGCERTSLRKEWVGAISDSLPAHAGSLRSRNAWRQQAWDGLQQFMMFYSVFNLRVLKH